MEKQLRKREILSIFIGSPGDLQEERKIAHNVVERINKNVGRNLGIYIELRGWEDTLPGYGTRPQEIINEELIECDIFVGLLWERWGTPPGGENGYTSGFEEEYYLALEQKENDEMLDIFLFFKDMSESLKRDPGEQATQVLNYKESVEKDRKVFFDTFSESADWKELFNDVLNGYITKNFISQISASKEGEQTRQSKKDTDKDVIDTIESFEIIQTSLREEDYYSVDNINIAKTTLYTTSLLYTKVLTDQVLNTKVLHLLYSAREEIRLQRPETELILKTLLEDQDEIKTGWYWINPDINVSTIMTYFAESDALKEVRLQALEFLYQVSTEKTREISHKIIEEENPEIAIEVAKQYSKLTDQNDIEFLQQIINEREEQLAKIAWSGIVHALMLENPNNAIDWIINSPPHNRGDFKKYLKEILSGADLNHQKKLLTTDDNKVRLITLNTICDQLSIEELQDLSKDGNNDISSLALMELIKRDQEVREDEIDDLFDKENPKNSSTYSTKLGDLLTNYSPQVSKYEHDDLLYEYYKKQDADDLVKRISWSSIKSPIIYAVLVDKNYDKYKELLKEDINSGFSRIREKTIEDYRSKYGKRADEIIDTVTKYDNMTKGIFYKYAFQVLSQKVQKQDLEIAKEYLENPHFSYFKDDILISILSMIEKVGDENETDLLLNILDISNYGVKRKAASLLLKLDIKDRKSYAQELFQQDEISIYKTLFNFSLDEEDVLNLDSVKDLTYKSNRNTRLAALSYLTKKLSIDNLKEFLDQYPSADEYDFYYYDVICWLDRIIYAPDSIKDYYYASLEKYIE